MANNIIGTVGVGAQSVKPDWNQNDPNAKDYIKNRPGGYAVAPSVEIAWDGNTTGKETMDLGGGSTLVKIADEAPPIDEFDTGNNYRAVTTADVEYKDGKHETKQEETELQSGDGFWYCEAEFCAIYGVTADQVTLGGITFTKGLWFLVYEDADDTVPITKKVTRSIAAAGGGVKKFPVSSMPDEVWNRISDAQDMAQTAQDTASTAIGTAQTAQSTANTAQNTANTAQSTANAAQSTANAAKTTAETAQNTANTAVKPTKNNENECWYRMYNSYAQNKTTVMALGSLGGPALGIKVNEKCPSVAFIPPAYGSQQADFEFRRIRETYRHPLITGIGGIVVYSSTPNSTKKFKITVDDAGTISATEVTT